MQVVDAAKRAREASQIMASLPVETRDAALEEISRALGGAREEIFEANSLDMADSAVMAAPLRKRLAYNEKKLSESIEELRALAGMPDPLGRTQSATLIADGMRLYRVSCPIGVIGVIFESRPDALVQIAALCLKSGNAALLKGGAEALRTNRALFAAMDGAARSHGMPEGWATLLETRQDVADMLALDNDIDLIIPRGSNAFVSYIKEHSRIPVLGHADGLCHVYVDSAGGLPGYPGCAVRVAVDSKTQYPAVCNACETLLVHRDAAPSFLPDLARAMPGVELRGCDRTRSIIDCMPAADADWDAEYLDEILAVRVVDSLDEAVSHINRHGSGHTDAIVTDDMASAARFLNEVDSADVFVNCSTRFSDGYRFGLGAELGVATGRVHARGPMGLEGLTIYKYKLIGSGQTVADTFDGTVRYIHERLDETCPL